jgi:hypothetical protein
MAKTGVVKNSEAFRRIAINRFWKNVYSRKTTKIHKVKIPAEENLQNL